MLKCIKEMIENSRVNKLLGKVAIKLSFDIYASFREESGRTSPKLNYKDMKISNLDITFSPREQYVKDSESNLDLLVDFDNLSKKDITNFLCSILITYANVVPFVDHEHPIFIKKILKRLKKRYDLADAYPILVTAKTYGGALDIIEKFLENDDVDFKSLGICVHYSSSNNYTVDEDPVTLSWITKKCSKYLLVKLKHANKCTMLSHVELKLKLKDFTILNQGVRK